MTRLSSLLLAVPAIFSLLCCQPAQEEIAGPAPVSTESPVIRLEVPQQETRDPLLVYIELKREWEESPSEELREQLRDILTSLAVRAEKTGDLFHARNYWKEILKLYPDDPTAREHLHALQSDITSEKSGDSQEIDLRTGTVEDEGIITGTTHFHIHLRGDEHFRNSSMITYLFEQAYLEIGSRLGLYSDTPVQVYLYTDREFSDITGLPPWVKGIYDGSIHLPVANLNENDPIIKQVIYHEYTHALIYHLTGNRCPLWLNEGLAQLMEPTPRRIDERKLLSLKRSGSLPDLSSRSFLTGGPETAERLYMYAYAVTKFLIETQGYWPLDNFFKQLKAGSGVDDAFQEAYLFPLTDLQDRYFHSIE